MAPEDIIRSEQETQGPQGLGLPHYSKEALGIDRILAYNYWNTNGQGIVILAIEGHANDWAAYIGAAGPWSEEEAVGTVAREGAKLSRDQAHRWFPQLPIEAYRE